MNHERIKGLPILLPKETPTLTFYLSLSYQSLVFKFLTSDSATYIECNYFIDTENSTLISRYFQDPEIEPLVDQFIGGIVPHIGYFVQPWGYQPLSETTNRYISIAESIALEAYQCTSGDNYSPACFSKIILTADGITLEQNNHMNAKSLAHKNDYSLRDLEFFIPFDSDEPRKKFFDEEYIGTMRIRFSDRSSSNNKVCGDKIRQRIDLERSKFT